MLTLALSCFGFLSIFQETIGSDFSELGRQLLAGFLVAVAVAVSFTVIKLRRRDKHPPAPFISIIAPDTGDMRSNSRPDGQ